SLMRGNTDPRQIRDGLAPTLVRLNQSLNNQKKVGKLSRGGLPRDTGFQTNNGGLEGDWDVVITGLPPITVTGDSVSGYAIGVAATGIILSLNGLDVNTQLFAKVDDTNVTLAIA